KIIADQPDFPLAHLGMHLGYTLLGTLGMMPAPTAFAKAQPFLERAIVLDENLPEVQLHLSYHSFLQDWDLPSAYRHLNKSFEQRPSVEYYQSMASMLVTEGKLQAAHNYIDTALQIDPFSAVNFHLKGFLFYVQEQYKSAIQHYEKSLELKPDAHISLAELGQAFLLSGDHQRALTFFEEIPLPQDDLLKIGGITMVYAITSPPKASPGIQRLEQELEGPQMDRATNLLILCHTLLGNKEKALELLARGIELKLPMVVYTQIDPILKPLRGHPEFQALVKQILGKSPLEDIPSRRYKKSLLPADKIAEYKRRLTELMEKEKPYLKPELSLRELAASLELLPNYLSQLLNEGFDQNFSEYVNTYRIAAFQAKVADPNLQHLTILGLAYESGFNSKTVFNTFFKKTTGLTPAAYRKQQLR
ncbi:MAG: helix-turn-helix domain-containing protein, partial [Bacteroidota bacterium]